MNIGIIIFFYNIYFTCIFQKQTYCVTYCGIQAAFATTRIFKLLVKLSLSNIQKILMQCENYLAKFYGIIAPVVSIQWNSDRKSFICLCNQPMHVHIAENTHRMISMGINFYFFNYELEFIYFFIVFPHWSGRTAHK